ncbi:hypothetical protein phicjt23_gp08 [Flavobacterium phage phiCjT23]|nr:hypothetical protein phicjt23_gp08 [Flavobacterium phage phiCjT23]
MFRFILKFLPLILHEGVDLLKEHLEKRKQLKQNKS